jgi:hypothetical protein
MNENLIKIAGLVATVVGIGATLLSEWVNDKKTDEKIEKKIIEALAKRV